MCTNVDRWLLGLSLSWEQGPHFGFLLPGETASIAAGVFLGKQHIQGTGGMAFHTERWCPSELTPLSPKNVGVMALKHT